MSREKTVYITILFNLFLQIVNFSYKFLVTPFLLGTWGDIKYGEWLVLFSFVSSISLLNFGIAKFYGNKLRKMYLNTKIQEYKNLFSEAIFLALLIFIFIGLGLFLIIQYIDIIDILNVHNWSIEEVKLSILLLGLSIAGSIFLEIISYFYVSVGKYSIQPILFSINLLVQLIFIILFSYFNVGIVTISAIVFGSVLSLSFLSLITFMIQYPNLIPNRFYFNITDIKANIGLSSYFQLITFSQFFILQGSVLLISNQLGGAMVSLFVITRTITSGLGRQLIQIINHGIWPELTSLFAEGDYEKLRLLHTALSKISIILTTFFILFVLLFIDDIFKIWLSTDEYLDYEVIGLFLGYLLVIYAWIPSSFILMANNDVKIFGILSVVSSLSFLILSYYLLPGIEIYGVIIIMIITDLIFMTFKIPQIACGKINENVLNFFIQMMKLLMPAILLFILFYIFWIDKVESYGLGFKVLLAFIEGSLISVYFVKIVLTEYEKEYLKNKFKKIILRQKG